MFDAIKKLIAEIVSEPEKVDHFEENDERLAEAALMFHVIAADGSVGKDERDRMAQLLSGQFNLSEQETEQLMSDAQDADNEAVDLYGFTSVLKRTLTMERRIGIIENMWEMVYADGVVHELEDNIVWRVAELLDVTQRDRMLLKKRVKERGQQPAV